MLTVLFFPGSVLTGVGGALFGVALGTVLSVVGATAGATAAFFIGRRLGRGTLERAVGRRARAVDAWLGQRGFTAVLYLRLFPIVPFNAMNYAAGSDSRLDSGLRGRHGVRHHPRRLRYRRIGQLAR